MDNNREMEFTEGLYAKDTGNAPEFIKAKLAIKVEEFGPWLKSKMKEEDFDGWVNLEVRSSRNGKWFVCVDTWKPDSSKGAKKEQESIDDDDMPF